MEHPPFGESIVNMFYFLGTPNQQIQVMPALSGFADVVILPLLHPA